MPKQHPPPPPSMSRPDGEHGPAAIHLQILATEHWSLLATRSMVWNEIFSRTGTFLTVLSATVVALSLVANAAGFGRDFRVFALLVLPIALFVGLGTYIRLLEADIEDAWLVVGMNRLRHAYLETAPELATYFVSSDRDDELGMLRTYSFRDRLGVTHLLAGSPVIVGIIDSVIAGVLAAIIGQAMGAPIQLQILLGVVAWLSTTATLCVTGYRRVKHVRRDYRPRFPT